MEDLHELSRKLVRDVLGPADPEHVVSKAEELIEVLGVISTCSDQDTDRRVTVNLEVVHHFSDMKRNIPSGYEKRKKRMHENEQREQQSDDYIAAKIPALQTARVQK
ncbi:hypothetical protein D9C73_010155 [Collichthys lucidus]|uniref:Uncharacterized protein n=1 Tax=Collichthys lucidus TaxID=240159 RepID=A0A4U5ULC1_COLLU|nr:hypothetical protein D9C73_010155 [Collichthys lucidus]